MFTTLVGGFNWSDYSLSSGRFFTGPVALALAGAIFLLVRVLPKDRVLCYDHDVSSPSVVRDEGSAAR